MKQYKIFRHSLKVSEDKTFINQYFEKYLAFVK